MRSRLAAPLSRLRTRTELLGLAAAALLLTGLSLHDLGRYSFWRDEVLSVIYASAPLSEQLAIVGRDRQVADVPFMATYNLLLHFWLGFADTEAQIRLLSVLAGVATVIPIYFIGRRLGGWLAGTLGALVFAASPYVIAWNQEARSYSLAMFVSATLTVLLLRAIERPTVLRWLLYGVVAALGVYVHTFVGLVIAVHAGYVILSGSRPPLRPLLAVAIPLGLAALPVPYLVLEYGSAYGWIRPLTVGQIRNTLVALAGGVPLLLSTAALVAVAMLVHRRDRRAWLIVAAAVAPIVVAILVSTVRPMLLTRYLVICLPSMAILAGLGLAALRPLAVRASALAGLAILLAVTVPSAYADSHQQDWRSAGGWIARSAGADDQVIVTPWGRRQLFYYVEQAETGVVPELTGIDGALTGATPDQLWVVMANLPRRERNDVLDTLADRYQLEEAREFGSKVHVVRMAPAG
jgi:mannosyltransferase